MASGSSKVVIYAALAGNLAIALTKFAASWWTGSGAMLSEALHSLVDTSNQGFLLLGLHRAARPASKRHPFGHGMEIYFWAFIVALMIFALGGAASIYEGIQRLRDPEPIRDPWVNFLVLGISFAIEATSSGWRGGSCVAASLTEQCLPRSVEAKTRVFSRYFARTPRHFSGFRPQP